MQSIVSPLERPNISESLVVTLRDMIVDGGLAAGERINEVHLAASLGVSRTPLREALGYLVAEGALTVAPRIGYFVCPLTLEEFQQIYPIRGILDPEALRLAGIPSAERLERLESLNQKLIKARGVEKVLLLDDAWHLELLAECPNRILIDLIKQFIRRTRRYEIALMRERRNVRATSNEHEKVLKALRASDLKAACQALRQNMQSGSEPIVAWLKARESATKQR
jgi:DNA-binding GntR family transcriptional regulator